MFWFDIDTDPDDSFFLAVVMWSRKKVEHYNRNVAVSRTDVMDTDFNTKPTKQKIPGKGLPQWAIWSQSIIPQGVKSRFMNARFNRIGFWLLTHDWLTDYLVDSDVSASDLLMS